MDGLYPPPPSPPPPPPLPYPPFQAIQVPRPSPSFSADGIYPQMSPPPPPPLPSAPSFSSQSIQGPYPSSTITMNVNYPPPPPPPPPPQFWSTLPVSSSTGYYPPGNVIIQVGPQAPVPWSTGLFDCCDDIGNCCMTCLCPCVTFGQVAEIVDRGSISCGVSGGLYTMILCLTGCHWMYSCFYRAKMRGQFMLEEGPIADCPVHCCCDCCALCQEYRELKNRGFDLYGGWEASMEKERKNAMTAPAVEGSMRR